MARTIFHGPKPFWTFRAIEVLLTNGRGKSLPEKFARLNDLEIQAFVL